MTLWHTITTGLRALASHRLRSVLTALGIIFGIAAVICTVGVGTAASDSINSRFAGLGTNVLTITPGSTSSGGVSAGAGSASTLTMQDAAALADQRNAPDIAAVAPVVQSHQTMVHGAQSWTTAIQGSTPEWLTVNARTVTDGQFITATDVSTSAASVVLGASTAKDLEVTTGETITIAGRPFTVIGILDPSGGSSFVNQDDLAVLPITTTQDMFAGGDYTAVQRIVVSAASTDTIGSAQQEANQVLLTTHRIAAGTTPDFTIQSQTSFIGTAHSISSTLTILLASVAAIALLIGGIGVMNIMLVSVTERTGEIGLRKALGATPSDLLRQFLVESASLACIGGLLGVGLALIIGLVVPSVAHIGLTITVLPVVSAVAMAAVVGLVFGVIPAVRASRLAPIEALRGQ